jgi:gentisate 1,2-dioxygenase
VVCEGAGNARVGDLDFTLGEDDIFVVPAWATYRFEASSDLVLFSFSDKAVQEKLNLWREARH